MRIGCLQFAPQVGDVNNNLNRADSVLNRADPEDLDILVLPELAFSGMLALAFFLLVALCLVPTC
jgi:protein N-terminal amidase